MWTNTKNIEHTRAVAQRRVRCWYAQHRAGTDRSSAPVVFMWDVWLSLTLEKKKLRPWKALMQNWFVYFALKQKTDSIETNWKSLTSYFSLNDWITACNTFSTTSISHADYVVSLLDFCFFLGGRRIGAASIKQNDRINSHLIFHNMSTWNCFHYL